MPGLWLKRRTQLQRGRLGEASSLVQHPLLEEEIAFMVFASGELRDLSTGIP